MLKLNKKGFTLIELLVVIAIIGILASVVMVSLSSARNKAKRASALSTVSGIGTEIIMCQDDALTICGQTDDETGGGRICRTAAFANDPAHTVEWPTLGTTGYCYSSANGACTAITNGTALPATFYLYDSDNSLITCTWSSTENLICSD